MSHSTNYSHHRRRRHRGNVIIILVILIAAGVGAYLLFQSSPAALHASVQKYKEVHDGRSGEPTGTMPARPAVVVDHVHSRIDDLNGRLPGALRATNDEEVKSIIILERHSTGVPGATVPGLAVASASKGSYSIAAFIYDTSGTLLQEFSARRESAMSGAGFEGELIPEVEADVLEWLKGQLQ